MSSSAAVKEMESILGSSAGGGRDRVRDKLNASMCRV
jgi:hypothetical protein